MHTSNYNFVFSSGLLMSWSSLSLEGTNATFSRASGNEWLASRLCGGSAYGPAGIGFKQVKLKRGVSSPATFRWAVNLSPDFSHT